MEVKNNAIVKKFSVIVVFLVDTVIELMRKLIAQNISKFSVEFAMSF